MKNRARLLLNGGLFQIGWLACVFGAQRPWLLMVALACLAVHLRWVAQDSREWRVLLRVAACGWVLDTTLLHLGLFDFLGARLVLPLWLALLWLLFASTLRYSLGWTARSWWLSSLLGAFGGPLSYLGGAKLADVSLPLGPWPSMFLLALIWALLLPALHLVARCRSM
ncbi:DUF2878 domain-containing protein [Pseudomonas sp. BBP2017]|uniref:DUF2878 domain-containing protein n=1 Tax=Pseudomonas sp. BBP2017 TaxID=2109731 RepID=UPI000D13E822|nr:DUF2878 domain-containing protein [Pseudomonas sp. BBP2017]PSS58750.1 DUF2878 domain-containing protein [Pseudomonas sp. BBP2017]